jgi:chemotaxis protein CheD
MFTTSHVATPRLGARHAASVVPAQPLVSTPALRRPAPQATPAFQAAGEIAATPGQSLLLMPGQLHFGAQAASLRTLLGSCVAITLWHPVRRLGGMCHFMLPSRRRTAGAQLDGRYGDEALERLVALLALHGTRPQEYVAHLYGGADTLSEASGVKLNIGQRNIEQGWNLVDRYGFQLEGVDVGDQVPRNVTLNVASGDVQVRRGGASL